MKSPIITNELANEAICLIETETSFRRESISFEIQDDYKHLLISISVNSIPKDGTTAIFKHVADLLNSFIPGRHGDYSWMVVFEINGQVLDSYFGGDIDCPKSGL